MRSVPAPQCSSLTSMRWTVGRRSSCRVRPPSAAAARPEWSCRRGSWPSSDAASRQTRSKSACAASSLPSSRVLNQIASFLISAQFFPSRISSSLRCYSASDFAWPIIRRTPPIPSIVRHVMGQSLAVLSCVVLLIPAGAFCQTRPLSRALPHDLTAGKRIFDAQCAWCHGTEGAGGSGPNLQRTSLPHASTDASLVPIVRTRIPGTEMPNFALSLTDRMAWQTAAYVRSLGRTAARPTSGDARRGAEVYGKTGCAACHVVDGVGGVVGPDLTAVGALRGPVHLRQSLVEPAAAHPPGYLVAHAVTGDGKEIRGILVNED